MAENLMHGYDAAFFPTLEMKYTCPVCLTALRNPVQTTCGHRFCKACLITSFGNRKRGRCPVDKKMLSVSNDIFLDTAVRREILSLVVKCNNHEKDCQWKGELRDLEKHMDKCPEEDVFCDMCGKEMLRRILMDHRNSCPRRLQNCSHCGMPVVFIDMPKHQLLVCNKFPVNCVVCGETGMLRDEIARHVDSNEGDCPFVTVACKFQHIGCYFQEKRKNMQSHYEVAGEHHVMLLSMKMVQNEEKINHQGHQISQISGEISDLHCTVNRQNRLIDSQDEMIAIQESRLLENQLGSHHVGNILWRISLHSHNGQQVESPSFYTATPGYKVRIIADLNGYTENNVPCMSLLLCLERGQYDDVLPFPFEGRCTVSLLDQDMSTSSMATVTFKGHGAILSEDNRQEFVIVGKKLNVFSFSDSMKEKHTQDGYFTLDIKVNHVITSC